MFEFHTRWRLHLGVHKLETVWITSLAKRNQKWRLYHLRHWLRPRKRFLSSSSPWSLQKQHATLQFPRYLSQCLQAIFPCRKSFMRLPNYFYQVIHSSNSHACSKYFFVEESPFLINHASFRSLTCLLFKVCLFCAFFEMIQIQEIMYNNDSTLTCRASVALSIKLGRNSLRFSKNCWGHCRHANENRSSRLQ